VYLNPIIAFSVAFLYFEEEIDGDQRFAYMLLLLSIIIFNWGSINKFLFKNSDKTDMLTPQTN